MPNLNDYNTQDKSIKLWRERTINMMTNKCVECIGIITGRLPLGLLSLRYMLIRHT